RHESPWEPAVRGSPRRWRARARRGPPREPRRGGGSSKSEAQDHVAPDAPAQHLLARDEHGSEQLILDAYLLLAVLGEAPRVRHQGAVVDALTDAKLALACFVLPELEDVDGRRVELPAEELL